ncbi:hypothetical protein PhCBS80983_g02373 [Powellomyces hirtus]|uniref:Major facilitator superfamily (MFS) profile domain-containing protein n=1 Tax=Powellomyces hirtus TaxID=109895 RepID=A0A507E7D5_9FUNG|nr:hypothetical protein PhCBS80983_g02373 [Powellomyces hirtus]
MPSLPRRLVQELGLTTVWFAGRNVHLLFLAKFLRMFAYGSSTLILAVYIAALGYSDEKIGLFMTLTLLGDVLVSLLLTVVADGLGRRRILLLSCLLMSASGIAFASSSNYNVLLVAAILGVISPSGNEVGPFRAVEESTLSHLSDPGNRSDVFAWYVVLGSLGTSMGSLSAGWLVEGAQGSLGWTTVEAYRCVFWMYTALGLAKAAAVLLLTSTCEPERTAAAAVNEARESAEETQPLLSEQPVTSPVEVQTVDQLRPPSAATRRGIFAHISAESRAVLIRLCMLFSVDSLASGMIPYSLIVYFLDGKFAVRKGELGSIMSVAWFVASMGNILASPISKRIGLVPTMVFTHLPSALFLALIPFPSSLYLTIALLFARSSLASMDQAPRSAFISMVVLPSERTAVMGIVNTLKTTSQSAGPVITGFLAANDRFWVAFVAAAACKVLYDLGMLAMFVGHKTREEEEAEQVEADDVDGSVPGITVAISGGRDGSGRSGRE